MDSNGDFFCKGTCYAHSEPLPATTTSSSSSSSKSPLVLFVSGLLLSSSLSLPAQLLIEFLSGQLGFLEDVKASSRISHAFFLGNNAKLPREPFQRIIQNAKEIETSSCGVSLLDELLSEVSFFLFWSVSPSQALPFVSISLIPGPTDAVSSLVPQQPLHPSLLPRSARFSSLERATNPFHALIQSRDVLGTAGQNIQDILRQITPPLSVLDVMALTLQWGVLFPTTPNTCRIS